MPEVGNKRASAVDEYGVIKQSKQGSIKLRILIKGVYTGALIGKGGENFKKLRETYEVKITGLSSRTEERVLQLDGNRNDCFAIVQELLPSCPEAPFVSQGRRLPVELNILVNTSQVGAVIGKAGGKLKEIRDQSGGGIKVYPDCLPNSTERIVAMGGENESVVLSQLDMVFSILDSAPLNTPTVYYDPSNPIGNTQVNQQSNVFTSSGTPNMDMGNPNMGMGNVDVTQILLARQENKKKMNPLPTSNDFGQVQTETKLTVPNLMVGAIIGKAGMNIRQIRISSGVSKIDIPQNESGDTTSDRTITITGTQDQIQVAEQLMMQFVESNPISQSN